MRLLCIVVLQGLLVCCGLFCDRTVYIVDIAGNKRGRYVYWAYKYKVQLTVEC